MSTHSIDPCVLRRAGHMDSFGWFDGLSETGMPPEYLFLESGDAPRLAFRGNSRGRWRGPFLGDTSGPVIKADRAASTGCSKARILRQRFGISIPVKTPPESPSSAREFPRQ